MWYTIGMPGGFLAQHKKETAAFIVGIILAIFFFNVPELHRALGTVDRLGYLGMFIAGLMYGSGLTSSIAIIIFVDAPADLNLIVVGLLGGLGAAIYDLTIFLLTRREAEHGWLATFIARIRERRHIPNWLTIMTGTIILISPLPDELAAGLFGINHGKAKPFFLLSFASNTLGVLLLSGVF